MTGEIVRLDQATALEVLTVSSLFLIAILGTVIAYQAYRGYRRNDASSMFYLSIGLLFLTLVPFVLNVAVTTLVSPGRTVTVFLENVSRLVGLLTIMYSLYGAH